MTGLQVVFLLIGAVTLASAVMVVAAKRVMHAALWLILALVGVAAAYATLEASFFAVMQVAVYVGAIAILIIFAAMLTRRSMEDDPARLNKGWPAALLAAGGLLAGLVYLFSRWTGFSSPARALPEGGENIAALGLALTAPEGFLVPFEVASLLLVAAMIGAIYVAGDLRK
ncbi:MAG: NADH-quinone oxidoreductase subunit J [Anaerolineaceae bacterium]|nr:NADH-quinone oxidoreductase subunit J [Anaerolineaceae bacterium]